MNSNDAAQQPIIKVGGQALVDAVVDPMTGDRLVPTGKDAKVRYKRSRIGAKLKPLMQVSDAMGAWCIAHNWLIIAAAAAFGAGIGTWWSFVLGGLVIGLRQHALMDLMHEGGHGLLFKGRRLNENMSDLFVSLPLFCLTELYRRTHFDHHRYLGTEKDPDLALMRISKDFVWPMSPARHAWTYAKDFVGVNLWVPVGLVLNWTPYLRLFHPVGHPYGISWDRKLVALGFLGALLAGLWAADAWLPFLYLWIIPGLTVMAAMIRMVSQAEHGGVAGDHELNCTRTTLPPLWERLTVAPGGGNYHIEHHLIPSVPAYRLKELHGLLMQDPEYRAHAHVTQSYYGLGQGVVRELSRGGPTYTKV